MAGTSGSPQPHKTSDQTERIRCWGPESYNSSVCSVQTAVDPDVWRFEGWIPGTNAEVTNQPSGPQTEPFSSRRSVGECPFDDTQIHIYIYIQMHVHVYFWVRSVCQEPQQNPGRNPAEPQQNPSRTPAEPQPRHFRSARGTRPALHL